MKKLAIFCILFSSLMLCHAQTTPAQTNPPVWPLHLATVSWTAAPTATGYILWRSTVSGGPYTPIIYIGSGTILSATDMNVVGGVTYYYVVTGFSNSTGVMGSFSNEMAGVIPADPTPFVPPPPIAAPATIKATVK